MARWRPSDRTTGPSLRYALVLLALIFALAPGRVEAHAAFTASRPEPGERLANAPGSVVLRFSEPINPKLSRASVTAPGGQRFDGASTAQEIQVQLATNAPGLYTVDWTTVSLVDGHALHGTFQFGVQVTPGEESEGATAVEPGPLDLLVAAARTVEYAALVLAVGLLLLRRLARRSPPLGWVRGRLAVPLAVALVGGLAVVLGETAAAAPWLSGDALVAYLLGGLPGLTRLFRLGAEALALALALVAEPLASLPLAAALLALAAAGHAAAAAPAWAGIGADAGHLVAAGLWAGGILALAAQRPPGGWRGPEGWKLLARFTPVALPAFGLTVAFGAVRAVEELHGPGDLLASSYGQVLAGKVLVVAAMVPLSFLAWRRRLASLRIEALLAVVVLAAAALLAAHPLPPARAAEAEAAAEQPAAPASALPQDGDLTLGGDAGSFLVGLTLRPARPGPNTVLVYLLPVQGEAAAAGAPADLVVGDRSLPLDECGPTCRRATLDLQGGEQLTVRVPGEKGGSAMFQLPSLPAPDGSDLLARMRARMHQLQRVRMDEVLGPVSPPIRSTYVFQTPDRMQSEVGSGAQTIWIGETRYTRDRPTDPWQVERLGTSLHVPAFIWDIPGSAEPVAPRLLGPDQVDGVQTQVLAFFIQAGKIPIWFRAWVDAGGLAHRAEMRAQGHFMDDHYFDFDGPFTIEPPAP